MKILINFIFLLLATSNVYSQNVKIDLAIQKYKEGNPNIAIDLLDSIINNNPKDTTAIEYKYKMCFYTNKEEESFKTIQLIYSLPEACLNFGNLHFSGQNYSNAIFYYEKALKVDSNYVDAIFNRGLCKKYLYNTKEAIEDFELAIKIKPNYMNVYNSLGNLYSSQFNYDKAIEVYEKAIKIDSTYKEAYYNKGLVLYKKQKYYQAKKSFDIALNIDPNFKEALYNRGLAKLKLDEQVRNNNITDNITMNDIEGACADLNKAYELGYERALNVIYRECP